MALEISRHQCVDISFAARRRHTVILIACTCLRHGDSKRAK